MLPRKFFENLRTPMAILVLFLTILKEGLSYFGPLTLSILAIMMHFVHTVSIMRA